MPSTEFPSPSLVTASYRARSFARLLLNSGATADDVALGMLQEAFTLIEAARGRDALRAILHTAMTAYPPLLPAGHA